jgi:hypothetical protein
MVPTTVIRISNICEKKILPGIRIRKNSITSTKSTNTRNKEVRLQQYFDRWKKKRKEKKIWTSMDG